MINYYTCESIDAGKSKMICSIKHRLTIQCLFALELITRMTLLI